LGEEVLAEDMDYAKAKNKVSKQKMRVAGEKLLEMPSGEELMVQFIAVRNRKKPKKSLNDAVKQSSNKNNI
jgi:hypothetical protein